MKKKAPQQTIAEQLAQAMAWHRDGRLPQAAAAYRAILAAEADHFDALHLLGVCALQDGDAPTAHGLIARALALKPDDVTAQMHLANAQQRLGQPDAALRSYRRVLELAPDDAMAFNNCGNLLREMQRHAEALAMFERALQCTRTTPRPTTIWAARWSTCTGTRRRCCVSNARCDWRRTIWTPTTTWATRCNCWVAPAPRCAATSGRWPSLPTMSRRASTPAFAGCCKATCQTAGDGTNRAGGACPCRTTRRRNGVATRRWPARRSWSMPNRVSAIPSRCAAMSRCSPRRAPT